MTQDDIYYMAQEAGIRLASKSDTIDPRNVYLHELERFADLVAAAEREACAKVCEETNSASFREAGCPAEGGECAAAIRARGE